MGKDTVVLLKAFSLAFTYPDNNLAELLVSGVLPQELLALSAEAGVAEEAVAFARTRLAAYRGLPAEDVMHELRQEYTRLFLGREPLVPNTEGIWRCRAEGYKHPPLIVNPRSMDVQKFQESCGVVRADGFSDCVDTVCVECEFAAYLASGPEFPAELGRTSAEAYREFVDSHMKQWIPGFSEDVRAASENVYYSGMVDLLEGFISIA